VLLGFWLDIQLTVQADHILIIYLMDAGIKLRWTLLSFKLKRSRTKKERKM